MNKISTLRFLVLALLILNVITLTFFLTRKPFPPRPDPGGVQKTLSFSDEQMNKLNLIRENHLTNLREQRDKLNELNSVYFRTLKSNNSLTPDSILTDILVLQKAIYENNYSHLNDIKELCNDNQIKAFDEFVDLHLKQVINRKRPR